MSTHYHCCTSLDGAIKNWRLMSVTEDGIERPATLQEVSDAVEDAKMNGYTVLPPCDNVDERGYCRGHKSEDPVNELLEVNSSLIDLIDLTRERTRSRMKIKKVRPSVDRYFINMAKVTATRTTCLRHGIGAVITKDKQILATGYNGAPSGTEHCLDIGCIRNLENIPSGTRHEKCRAVHAEQNAIIQAAIHGVSIFGATLYCTHQPCILCAKMIINSGIKRVVFEHTYLDTVALGILKEAGVKVEKLTPCRAFSSFDKIFDSEEVEEGKEVKINV